MTVPSIRQTPLRKTKRGYVRQIGRHSGGNGVFKFYLGHDMATAAQRRQWVEQIYVENCRLIGNDRWSEIFLNMAKQVARLGSAVVTVTPPPEAASHFGAGDYSFVHRLREIGVPIFIEGQAFATVPLPRAVTPENTVATIRLHAAIEAYRKDRTENYAGGYAGRQRLKKQIDQIIANTEDCWLHTFGFPQIKRHVDFWRGRPKTEHNGRCARSYASNQISEFYSFLNWADATYGEFALPNLSAIDRRVPRVASDAVGNAITDVHWTPAELREIYKTAQPLTRLIIALGLNTCSGAAELGRMRIDDFLFDTPHPKAKIIRFDQRRSWLITTRQKTHTHSEAVLWSWLVPLVQEQIAACRRSRWQYLFTEKGEPLYRDNDIYADVGLPMPNTTKPESRFVRRFNNAVEFAFKQKRIDRKLSLGKLRKTFPNYLANEAHSDLATLALAHQTSIDQLLKHYANQPYARLFRETLEAESEWDLTQ